MDCGSTSAGVPISTSILGAKSHSDSRQGNPRCQSKRHRCRNGPLQMISLFCSVIHSDHNASSHGDSIDKTNHQKIRFPDELTAASASLPKIIAYDQGNRQYYIIVEINFQK